MSTAMRRSIRLTSIRAPNNATRAARWMSVRRVSQQTRSRGRDSSVRNQPVQKSENNAKPSAKGEETVGRNTQLARALAESASSDLVAPVRIPDDPDGVLPPGHPALAILGNSSLVIQRQLEMMNVIMGYEQANRYIIMDGQGQTLGYIAEEDHGIGTAVVRQAFRTHRSFTTHIFDVEEREVLRIHRPFQYINSRIRIYDPVPESGYDGVDRKAFSSLDNQSMAQLSPLKIEDMRIIGEAQQQWAPLRRKYNLFSYRAIEPVRDDAGPKIESGEKPATDTMALTESSVPDQAIEAGMSQFAHVNEPFLSWDFTLRDEDQSTVGSVNRDFSGFAREAFTDTGVYALRMDSATAQNNPLASAEGKEIEKHERDATSMALDQRAVMLATAISIDFDYFSRHRGVTGFWPMFWPMGGGAAEGGAVGAGAGAAGGAAAGEAGAIGAGVGAMEGVGGAVGGATARGLGTGARAAAESGIAGAGTMAGYEAMQRGMYGSRGGQDDASPQAEEPFADQSVEQAENRPGNDDVWGEDQDPWNSPPSAGSDGGGGGGGWLDTISDFFTS